MDVQLVQIKYKAKTEVGEFSDALYYPLSAFIAGEITPEQIELDKAERIFNWIDSIKNPVVIEGMIEEAPIGE